MEIHVTNRYGIEGGYELKVPYIVISIHSPGLPQGKVPLLPKCLGVLTLCFSDCTSNAPKRSDIKPFTRRHAQKIRRFVESHKGAKGIIVHCEAGRSRSPAVAAALAECFGQDSSHFFYNYNPNQHVYEIMRHVAPRGGKKNLTTPP